VHAKRNDASVVRNPAVSPRGATPVAKRAEGGTLPPPYAKRQRLCQVNYKQGQSVALAGRVVFSSLSFARAPRSDLRETRRLGAVRAWGTSSK
jgi:hypothetical protein